MITTKQDFFDRVESGELEFHSEVLYSTSYKRPQLSDRIKWIEGDEGWEPKTIFSKLWNMIFPYNPNSMSFVRTGFYDTNGWLRIGGCPHRKGAWLGTDLKNIEFEPWFLNNRGSEEEINTTKKFYTTNFYAEGKAAYIKPKLEIKTSGNKYTLILDPEDVNILNRHSIVAKVIEIFHKNKTK